MSLARSCVLLVLLVAFGCAAPSKTTPGQPPPPEPVLQPENPLAGVTVLHVPAEGPWLTADELPVWRTREALPPHYAPHVPADFDFARFSIAGPRRAAAEGEVLLADATAAEGGEGDGLLIDASRAPRWACEPCRGISVPNHDEKPAPEPVVLWKVPASARKVVLRLTQQLCPPCLAP